MNVPAQPPLLVLVGPTAVGKTALALRLAGRFAGEIISADAWLVYRGMDIGAAKPTPVERAAIPHALIDIIGPDEPFGLAQYQRLAYAAIAAAHAASRLPLLVGGAGQYVRAVVEGWGIPEVPPQPELRQKLEAEAESKGAEALHRRLAAADPAAAARIDPRNVRRVIRALEVYLTTGRPISELQRRSPPAYTILQIGLRRGRAELYRRIDARVDAMMAAGLLEEVRRLRAAGYADDLPSMAGLGYRQLAAHLRGEMELAEAVELIKRDTRRYVHQQMVWFREDDPAIAWFDAEDGDGVEARVAMWQRQRRPDEPNEA